MKLRKTILGLLFGTGVAWVLAFTWIHLSYSASLPGTTNQKTGHTYRMIVNHGFIRYGTKQQFHAFQAVEDFQAVASFATFFAGVLGMYWGIIKMPEGQKRGDDHAA